MRLRITIIRHGLPATRILWTVVPAPAASEAHGSYAIPASAVASTRLPNTVYGHEGCTVAQLLEDLNEVVPLETAVDGDNGTLGENDELGGQWGLEDYVVEVDGFECLHFMHVDGLLRDGDEVVIRSLGLGDLRARRLAGRMQVTTDGRRLIDGVPFGRHFLQRAYSSRPPVRIPPRKRRRTMNSLGWPGNLQNEDFDNNIFQSTERAPHNAPSALYDEGSPMSSRQGTVIRHPGPSENYRGWVDGMIDDDAENDMDYSEDYSEDAEEDLAEELNQLREEAESNAASEIISTRGSGRKSRMAHHDPPPTSSPARPSTAATSHISTGKGGEIEATPKSSKSVRFEARKPDSPVEHDDESESDEESMSDANSTVSSSDDDSSEASSDEDSASVDSESESDSDLVDESSTSEEEGEEEESESEVENPLLKNGVFTAPGRGSTRTKNSNRRKKLRQRLQKLKALGELTAEANFDDLREWEAKHGKRPLTELEDLESLGGPRAREQSTIEIERQKLIDYIATGGIDIDGWSEKENIPPRYPNGKPNEGEVFEDIVSKTAADEAQAEREAAGEDEKASPTAIKRRKLDLSSTKRLLFGSLGVRTPKSKKDEEALRTKLAGARDKYLPKATENPAAAEVDAEDDIDENWQKKIILSATECVFDDIKLAVPPFPFQQRWDADASYEIRQRRNNGKRSKKRKERDWQNDADTSWYDGAGDDANGDTTLNYYDAPSTIEKEDQTSKPNGDDFEDLPTIPTDPSLLPALREGEATAGAIIAFKQLDVSKATNWQPQVSEYKVAKVDEVLDNGSLNLVLAKRDRDTSKAAEVDEHGVRTYSSFEMPDEDEGTEDDGFRNLPFIDLMEPKLLRPAGTSQQGKEKEDEQVNGDHDASSLYNGLPPPIPVSARDSNNPSAENSVEADDSDSAPEAPVAVSSQTRLDISHMIHDAGFRSAIDSDLGLSMPMSIKLEKPVPTRDSDNDSESEASDSSSSPSDESSSDDEEEDEDDDDDDEDEDEDDEFSSSPPEAMIEEQLQQGFEHDAAEKGDEDALDETNSGMAADMDDSGFQMNVDDDEEGGFGMNGRPENGSDIAGSHEGDNSSDEMSLPEYDGGLTKKNNDDESGLDTGEEEAGTSSNQENPGTSLYGDQTNSTTHEGGTREHLSLLPQNSSQEAGNEQETMSGEAFSQKNKTAESSASQAEETGPGKGKVEDKSFLSTTLRGGDSQLQDSFVTVSAISNESDHFSSDYSDANSTVQHPFYERDRIARELADRNAGAVADGKRGRKIRTATEGKANHSSDPRRTDAPSSPIQNSGSKDMVDPPPQLPQSIEGEKEEQIPQLDDFNSGALDQPDDEDSDPDFPSIEVLWASTAPSREPFPPIKTEGERQSSDRHEKENPAVSSLPLRKSGISNGSSPPFLPVSTTTTTNTPATANKQSDSIPPSSTRSHGTGQEQEGNESGQDTSLPAPIFEPGSEPTHNDDHDDRNDENQRNSPIAEDDDNKQQDTDNNTSTDQPAPMTIDLTLSSPLVSPVDQGSDEDFAKSQGLPKGPGWVKKNVPPTQRRTRRQTRSSTGEAIVLSSSPAPSQRRRSGRQIG